MIKLLTIHILNYLGFSQGNQKLNQTEEQIKNSIDLKQMLDLLLTSLSPAQISYLPIVLRNTLTEFSRLPTTSI